MRYSEIRFDALTTFLVDSSTILNLEVQLNYTLILYKILRVLKQ